MALPLLMGIGLGYLGGSQFLLKKADDRAADSMLDQAMNAMSNTAFGQAYGDQLGMLLDAASEDRGFLDAGRTDRIQSLLDGFMANSMQYDQWQLKNQMAANQRWQQSNEGILTSVQEQRQANQERFGRVQQQGRLIDSLYKGGDLSGNNLQGMINAVARMQFPDEALNEGDISRIISGSPTLANWANQIANLKGRADPELAESIYNFGRDLYSGYQTDFEAGERNVNEYIESERNRGYLPTDRVDRRYGTYDPGFTYGPADGGANQQAVQSANNKLDAMTIQALIDAGIDPIIAAQGRLAP